MSQLDVDQLIKDLERDEDVRLKVYLCPAGFNTIGCGRNLDDLGLSEAEVIFCEATAAELIAGKSITAPMSRYLLRNDIARCQKELDKNAPWWRNMPEPAQRALCNMLFNMGWSRLSGFKHLMGALKSGLYVAAGAHAKDSAWYTQVGDRAKRIVAMFESCAKVAA